MLAVPDSIDIIIPTFRLDEQYLLPLIHLPKPGGWQFNYYIIADNPGVKPGAELQRLAKEGVIHLFINSENKGPGETRNRGIEAGNGSWILFLDDDIVADSDLLLQYVKATKEKATAIGFIGLTDFPAPVNAFTRALDAAGLTSIFTIAKRKEQFMWGVTANIMFKRSALQDLRFSPLLSAIGGGEDIDLGARVSMLHGTQFMCVKEARVTHPWWNHAQPHFDRFTRYGAGMALLLPRFKKFTWYAFPNPIEGWVLALLCAPLFFIFLSWQKWLIFLAAIPLIDMGINYVRAAGMGYRELKVAYYMTLLRCSTEWGMFKTMIGQGKPAYFMKRINVDFTRPRHFRTNRWRITKLVIYLILLSLLIFIK
ncbi:glycosyltransferase [Chitinophaga sp. CC14]|uniref:glycosyltransferase family 2 protein n=1 Tax=Chitinophaga sp. CC14 TaxID=3029199 RepID=UPI003B7AF502